MDLIWPTPQKNVHEALSQWFPPWQSQWHVKCFLVNYHLISTNYEVSTVTPKFNTSQSCKCQQCYQGDLSLLELIYILFYHLFLKTNWRSIFYYFHFTCVGAQGRLPPNVPQWHIDYCEFQFLKTLPMQEGHFDPPVSLKAGNTSLLWKVLSLHLEVEGCPYR